MADDFGYECLGANGVASYETPNLDGLAASGVRFTACYGTPLCTSSRVQIMTGQYPFRSGWPKGIWTMPREQQVVDPKYPNFAHILKSAGYGTAVAGKWQLARFDDHPNHATEAGFDEHCLWTWVYGRGKHSRYWGPHIWQNGRLHGDLAYNDAFGPDIFTDFLIDFIRRRKDGPFFAYYPMALTHKPFVNTPLTTSTDDEGDLYAGMVTYADHLVGRIVAALENLTLRKDTLILFTGDNGTPRQVVSKKGKKRIRGGKGRMSVKGTHVPLIANWTGNAPHARVCEDLIDFTDVLPTLAEAAGARIPAGHMLDGRSFLPQILGRKGDPREWVFVQHENERAIRTVRWKLFGDGRLFDMKNDRPQRAPITSDMDTVESAAARETLEPILARLI
jgi:arylsulfatase A